MNLTLESLPWFEGVQILALSDGVQETSTILGTTDNHVQFRTDSNTENLGVRCTVSIMGSGWSQTHPPHYRGHTESGGDDFECPEGREGGGGGGGGGGEGRGREGRGEGGRRGGWVEGW